jgi:pilus assembly protein Flp/PilA
MLARIATRIQVARTTRNDEGATAVEYGLLVALIAAVIVVAVGVLGGYINDAFTAINDELAP